MSAIGARGRSPRATELPSLRRDRTDDATPVQNAALPGASVASPPKRPFERRALPEQVDSGPSVLVAFAAFGVIGFLLSALASIVAAAWLADSRWFFLGFGGVSIVFAGLCGLLTSLFVRRFR